MYDPRLFNKNMAKIWGRNSLLFCSVFSITYLNCLLQLSYQLTSSETSSVISDSRISCSSFRILTPTCKITDKKRDKTTSDKKYY